MPASTDADKKLIKELCTALISSLQKTYDRDDNDKIIKVTEEESGEILSSLPSYDATNDKDIVLMWDTGCFFPGLRIMNKFKEVNITKESVNRCTKIAKKRGTMGPGVLWFFCGIHKKCLGFVVMYEAESCKTVCETLITWFEKAPSVIIYDNACNLEEYISNRYPKHFEKTCFFVDAFHYKGHSNCAATYNSGLYKEKLCNINTSLLEQKNSKIRHIKQTAPFLKTRTFMAKLRYTVLKLNTSQ